MTSFGYRSNPRYAIQECSSCGTLYTRNCACSIGTVEDMILVPKPPKNCARCTRCGYLVDGLNCQGCALLRQELEENLIAHSPDFQNTSEPPNASTNVVNAPREPNVTKQDNGIPVISNPEPCNNQTINKLPQALPIFHPTFHSKAESPFILESTPTYVYESPNVFHPPPQPSVYPCEFCGNDAYYGHYCTPQAPFIYPEPSQSWKFPVCYDDDDDEESSNSLNDNFSELPSFSAITPDEPVLSTKEPDNSLSMGDEHLNTLPATESDEFIKSCAENLVPNSSESEGENGCDVLAGFTTFSNVLFDD
nr:hypothetical protein [Tanacetum cinerariifolium]